MENAERVKEDMMSLIQEIESLRSGINSADEKLKDMEDFLQQKLEIPNRILNPEEILEIRKIS